MRLLIACAVINLSSKGCNRSFFSSGFNPSRNQLGGIGSNEAKREAMSRLLSMPVFGSLLEWLPTRESMDNAL